MSQSELREAYKKAWKKDPYSANFYTLMCLTQAITPEELLDVYKKIAGERQ